MSLITSAGIALLVAGAAIYAVIVYNGLVRLQNEIGRAWANIDVLLKQRHDEVPNLVACVKGYMDHERQNPRSSDRGPRRFDERELVFPRSAS